MSTWPCLISEPPSAPLDVQAEDLTSNSVQLSWKQPDDLGGRTDLTYSVECEACEDQVLYSPRPSGLNATRYESQAVDEPWTHFKTFLHKWELKCIHVLPIPTHIIMNVQ